MFLACKHRKLAFKSPLQTIPRKEGLHVALKGQWWGFRTFFKQLFWSEELGGRFQYSFNFHLHLGKWSNLIHIFWMGWNHQLHMSLALKRFHVCFFFEMAIVQGPVEISKRFGLPLIKRPKRVSVRGPRIFHGDLRYPPQCHPHLQEIRV